MRAMKSPRPGLSWMVGLWAALTVLGCGSGKGNPANAGSADAGDASVFDASSPDGNSAADGNAPDGSPTTDGGADGSSPYGDRNIGVSEPYPSSVRIQNGGRVYDVTAPPTASQHAAKGDGVAD